MTGTQIKRSLSESGFGTNTARSFEKPNRPSRKRRAVVAKLVSSFAANWAADTLSMPGLAALREESRLAFQDRNNAAFEIILTGLGNEVRPG